MTAISQVKAATAAVCGVTVRELEGLSRQRRFARPRQIAMYVAMNLRRHTTTEVGRAFGDRDHTTVMHAVKRVRELPDCLETAESITAGLLAHTPLVERVRRHRECCIAVADGLKGWGGVRFDLGKTYNQLRGWA